MCSPAETFKLVRSWSVKSSNALVDLALRRRFAFIDLEPNFDAPWYNYVLENSKISPSILQLIQTRTKALNQTITNDLSLGNQFQIGHSYLTPTNQTFTNDHEAIRWFQQVVTSEIGPLLDEYWFDQPSNAQKARKYLLEGLLQ